MSTWRTPVLGAACLAVCGLAAAQGHPSRPLRIIVPYPPGGASDLVSRLIAARMTTSLGQAVVIENRAGGNAMIGTELAARAAPDGYTLLFTTPSPHTQVQFLFRSVPYDPVRDFTPITAAVTQSSFLLANPTTGFATFADFIDYARRNPGKLAYGTANVGSNFHLAGETIKQMAGIDMLHIPYKGGGQVMPAVVSGEVPLAIFTDATATPALKAGKLKALAAFHRGRLAHWPDVPSIDEILPGFDKPGEWLGFYGPARLPLAIRDRLYAEIQKALNVPEARGKLDSLGIEVLCNTPVEFAELIRHDTELNRRLLQAIGLRPE